MDLSKNVPADQLRKEKILCVGFLIDNSGTMDIYMNVVPQAWRTYLDIIANSSEKSEILVNPMLFAEGDPISRGYRFVEDQTALDYTANGRSTYLYRSITIALNELNETVASYKREGFRARGLLIVLSDGLDNSECGYRTVQNAINAIKYTTDNNGVVAYIAFGSAAHGVAQDLGVTHVKETNATVQDLEELFVTASNSTVSYSKSNGIAGGNFFDNAMSGGTTSRVNR